MTASAPKRILLAEDDPEGVELTLAALAEAGLADDVETVADGQEVLDYLHRVASTKVANPATRP